MTMGYDNKGSSGIVCVVSRQAGTVAGTSMVISKKIAGCGITTVTAAKDWIKRPLKCLVPARDKKSSAASQESVIKPKDEQQTGRKKAAEALIAAMQSDLAAAQRDLKKARSKAEKTQSKLASQLDEAKVEKESLISDLEQAKSKASEAATRVDDAKTRITVLESDLTAAQRQLGISHKKDEEDAKAQPLFNIGSVQPKEETVLFDKNVKEKIEVESTVAQLVVAEIPSSVVTDEQVQAAVFQKATDKIIFARALSDIVSQDATVRVDAAKMMTGIHHELSVKALAGQMDCESSAQVRQECIKALATLGRPEATPTVERALADEAGSVRLAAVWGLYHLAGAESAPALIRMFADNDEEVRRRAATCIGWLGKEEFAVELLPLLDDNSVSVRRAAAEAMGNLRNRQVVSSLIERLSDPVESVRKVVLSALEKITGKKMGKSLPEDQKEFERLIARWQQWRKEQLLG